MGDASEIARFAALAEEALSAIYDARGTDARAALQDARYNFERARDIALILGLADRAAQLDRQLARVQAAYDSRFKKKRPTAP